MATHDEQLAAFTFPSADDCDLFAWSADALLVGSNSGTVGASGRQLFTRIWLPAVTITNLHVGVRTAGATFSTGNLMGIFSAAGASLRETAELDTVWNSTGYKTIALTSTLAIATAGYHYVGIINNSTTLVAFGRAPGDDTTNIIRSLATSSTRLGYTDTTTRTAFLASYTFSSLSAISSPTWVGVS